MSKKDWEVGPVLKDKAGSQGTLFRGGTKFSSEARYPKGYGPERLNAVREKTNATRKYLTSDQAGNGPERRRMVDTIARSTVPLAHLQGVQFMPGQLKLEAGGSASEPAGIYHQARVQHRSGSISDIRGLPRMEAISPGVIGVKKGHEDDDVVIHEIGHHASMLNGTNSAYKTAEERGVEEGRADDYAHEHYREKRGKQTWRQKVGTPEVKSVYAGGARSPERTEEFFDAYHAQRGTMDPDWSRPTAFMREEARKRENDNASALFQVERNSLGNPSARTNPLAVPKGVDPAAVLEPGSTLRPKWRPSRG